MSQNFEESAAAESILVPKSIIACVHKQESAALLKEKYDKEPIVEVLANENIRGVEQGDIIVLGVEPSVYREVLAESGILKALAGKILVTIVGGLSIKTLETAIYGSGSFTNGEKLEHCRIVRVIPSTATMIREAMTLIIEEEDYPYASEILKPVHSLFMRVGQVKLWPAAKAPIGATLTASSLAFFTFLLEAVVDAGVSLGVDRGEALEMATAGMRGAAGLLASGEDTSEVKRKIATKGGSTEVGFKALEEGNVKEVVEGAVKNCAIAIKGLVSRTLAFRSILQGNAR